MTLASFCEDGRDDLVSFIESMVRLESPTTDKTAVDRCGRAIAGRLEQLGATVERLPRAAVGDLLRTRLGDAGRRVLLLGHFDTVWPLGQVSRMPIERRDGRLHGPGVYDMKAGIGIALQALDALRACHEMRGLAVTFLLTTDEETGSEWSRDVIESEARGSDAVLVLEPSLAGGAVKTSRKACGDYRLRVTGVPAHAGVDPDAGVSAIAELARQILALEALRGLVPGVTCNVGVVTGGTRSNVVAEHAEAEVDVRAADRSGMAKVEEAMRALAPVAGGARLEVSGGFSRPPLERSPGVIHLYGLARRAAALDGWDLGEGGTGGGSDGNFTAALGVPTLDGIGAEGDGAHALHEHVRIDRLSRRAAWLARLLVEIRDDGDLPGGATAGLE